jgi:YD repeat-containing protein
LSPTSQPRYGKLKFSYDRFGNRFRKAADNTTGSPTTNWVEDNQIDPATNGFVNSTTGITYDEAGNVTADPKFRGLQYKYDANGRMIWSATTANTPKKPRRSTTQAESWRRGISNSLPVTSFPI